MRGNIHILHIQGTSPLPCCLSKRIQYIYAAYIYKVYVLLNFYLNYNLMWRTNKTNVRNASKLGTYTLHTPDSRNRPFWWASLRVNIWISARVPRIFVLSFIFLRARSVVFRLYISRGLSRNFLHKYNIVQSLR